MDSVSGVGVLDKAVAILDAVATGPCDLAALVETTGINRATAHRLARALEAHRLVERDDRGRFVPGIRLLHLGASGGPGGALRRAARPALEALAAATGESVQLFVRDGDVRVCIDAIDSARGLRDIVPAGARLPLTAGSGGKVLRACADDGDAADLVAIRRRGWAESVAEREPGVASVSAPVFGADRLLVAAVSVSGPIERMTRRPGRRHGAAVVRTAREIGARLDV